MSILCKLKKKHKKQKPHHISFYYKDELNLKTPESRNPWKQFRRKEDYAFYILDSDIQDSGVLFRPSRIVSQFQV